jgi:putative holliday junction resolvase
MEKKRSGIATTDPSRIIAAPLTTVETKDVFIFFETYFKEEIVDCLVIGEPTHKDGTATSLETRYSKVYIKFF